MTMMPLARITRHTAAAAIGAGAIALLLGGAPAALADPPAPPPPPAPGCSAADFEQLRSQVAAATAGYMFTHPDVNAFFSSLKGQPRDQMRTDVKNYMANNPQVQSDLAGIRQPLRDMKARCQ
jgi:heme-binding protein